MRVFENSFIYFIQGETTGLIKIGKTNGGVEERMTNLQTGSPDFLRIIGVTFEPYSNEYGLHCLFSQYRKHGEWFMPSEEIIEYIEKNCFKNVQTAYSAYYEIKNSSITYEVAIKMDESKLLEILNDLNKKRIERALNVAQ